MSKSKCWLLPGRTYSFGYPRHNYERVQSYLETRRARVKYVRDTKTDPLDAETRELNPLLSRGRWLVVCDDLEKGGERSFYFESMESPQEVSNEEPLANSKYCVVEHLRVTWMGQRSTEAIAFLAGRERGVMCSVLGHSEN